MAKKQKSFGANNQSPPPQRTPPLLTPRLQKRLLLLAGLTGMFAPWWVISVAGMNEFVPWPAAPAPFGFHCIAVAQLLVAWPLAWWLACYLNTRLPESKSQLVAMLAMVAGALTLVTTNLLGSTLADSDLFTGDMLTRTLARAMIALLLLLPWSCSIRLLLTTPPNYLAWNASLPTALLLAILATLPVTFYSAATFHEQLAIADSYAKQQRLTKALGVTQQLIRLGEPEFPFRESEQINLTDLTKQINADIGFTTERGVTIKAALSVASGADADRLRIDLAQQQVKLDQLNQAREVLGELPTTHPAAARLMARIAQLQGQYAESNRWTQLLIDNSSDDPQFSSSVVQLQMGMTENLRKLKDYELAEQTLHDALRRSQADPQLAARVQLELGDFYGDTGRPGMARKYLLLAANSEAYRGAAEAKLAEIRRQTPICMW